MTGHTKEPWEVQPAHEDGALFIIGSNLGGLVGAAHAWPSEIEIGDHTRIEANARRIVDCVNALATIPDPLEYVQAARGCVEAAQRLSGLIYDAPLVAGVSGETACEIEEALHATLASLTALRAATGEQS